MTQSIEDALMYARRLIGLPYRWFRAGEQIVGDDKFYASNDPAPTAESLFQQDKCIVCTGIPNLMRRFNKLCVPYAGTTDSWFYYLKQNTWLRPFNVSQAAAYPIGTLVLRDFGSLEYDQGHVAVIIEPGKIIHAYAEIPYTESAPGQNAGVCGISDLLYSHYYDGHPGYYTHICSPEDWLMKN